MIVVRGLCSCTAYHQVSPRLCHLVNRTWPVFGVSFNDESSAAVAAAVQVRIDNLYPIRFPLNQCFDFFQDVALKMYYCSGHELLYPQAE